jgi:dTDP-4-dehydrorhamnose reductase
MIELFADIFFTPTPIELLNENVLNIIEQNIFGIFHICGNQRLSRYEFAIVIKNFNSVFKATLIPSSGHENMHIFQTDLSLFPSKICIQKQSLEDYLREEIKND